MALDGLHIDAAEVERLAARMAGLSASLRERVIRRSMVTVLRKARPRVIDEIADGTDLPKRKVGERVKAFTAGGEMNLTVRSPWLPLIELGAARRYGKAPPARGGGVSVRGWGRHKGAFLATMGAHRGVYVRKGKGRFPVKELWGPNPAAHVLKNEGQFLGLLEQVARTTLVPEIERQIDLALAGL